MKLTALDVDVLTPVVEKPEPIPLPTGQFTLPINPLLFPADWSSQVEVTTRWQTDVTRSANSLRSHKAILASRPNRSMRVRITGLQREESHALLQSCLAHTQRFGVPVPLYCDAVPIDAVVLGAIGQVRVYGDFRWRRFFEGGRVAIMRPLGPSAAGERGTVLMTILEVTPGQMLLAYNLLDVRAVTTSDRVVPCIDVELAPSLSGSALTDSVYQVDLSFNEVEGASSLPGLWPAPSPDNAEAMAPLCSILDNHPVFPIELNWAEGVEIEAIRNIGSDASGRTQVQEPVGPSFQRFTMQAMGHNREACWKILRFFDACRGRARAFWLIHPTMPWTLLSFPSLGSCLILATGRREDLLAHFKDVVFVRPDKTLVRRSINSVTDFTDAFQLNFDPLPDTDFSAAQPIHLCSFDDDAVTEAWATDGVLPAVQLRAVEEPDYGDVSVIGGSLGFTPQEISLLTIPDCTFLARAGGPAQSVDGKDSLLWPARGSTVGKLLDMSTPATFARASSYPLRSMNRVGAATCSLARFQNRLSNGGQPTIFDPVFSMDFMLDDTVPVSGRQLWGASGWTLFLCFTPETLQAIPNYRRIVEIWDSASRKVHFFSDRGDQTGVARCGLLVDTTGAGGTYTPLTQSLNQGDYPTCVTIRFDRVASRAHVWVNGKQALAAPVVTQMFTPSAFTTSKWMEGFDWAQLLTSPNLRTRFGQKGCFNMLASYARPLSTTEMGNVHDFMSRMYGSIFLPVSIY